MLHLTMLLISQIVYFRMKEITSEKKLKLMFIIIIIIPTDAQISSLKLILKLLPICFGVNTPSSGNLQLCHLKP
jgi:hypothetical protein